MTVRIATRETTAHGGRPSPAESRRISAWILDAARKLFLRDGFAQTSMDAIAAEIGISKRTLYARHPSKAALFEAMVIDIIEVRAAKFVTDIPASGSLREKLLIISELVLAAATDPVIISLERVITGESRQFPQLAGLIYQHAAQIPLKVVSEILRDAGTDGPDPERDADIFLSVVVLPAMRSAVLQRTPPGLAGVDRAFLERSIDIFVKGIGKA